MFGWCNEICERGIKEHFGVDFASTEEYKNLKTKTLRNRNLIAHDELLEDIDRQTCWEAIKAVQNAEDFLSIKCF